MYTIEDRGFQRFSRLLVEVKARKEIVSRSTAFGYEEWLFTQPALELCNDDSPIMMTASITSINVSRADWKPNI